MKRKMKEKNVSYSEMGKKQERQIAIVPEFSITIAKHMVPTEPQMK